jgi:hypothetical protein
MKKNLFALISAVSITTSTASSALAQKQDTQSQHAKPAKVATEIKPMTLASADNGLDAVISIIETLAQNNGKMTSELQASIEQAKQNKDKILESIISAKKAIEQVTGEEYVIATYGLYLLAGFELPTFKFGSRVQVIPTSSADLFGIMMYDTNKGGFGANMSWKAGTQLEITKRDASGSSITFESSSRFQWRPLDLTVFFVPKKHEQKLNINHFSGTYGLVGIEIDIGEKTIPLSVLYSANVLNDAQSRIGVFAVPLRINIGKQELPFQFNVGAQYISTDTVEDLMKITGKK